MRQLYIGLMSGTSIDGVDVTIVDFNNATPTLVSTYFTQYTDQLFHAIKSACQHSSIAFHALGQLDAQLGDFYAQCINLALKKAGIPNEEIIAIGSHGQTIQHSPNSDTPYTIQIGDANRIAEHTGIAVVADFRRRDIAAGGQGAPLVPAFHQAIFRSNAHNIAIVNIGGISNLTLLHENEELIGFDCGPGNTLMDQWCQTHFNKPYDHSGDIARSGHTNPNLLDNLLSDPYFSLPHPKSTGPEYFNMPWLAAHLKKHPSNEIDVLRTLCELSAICIAQSLEQLPHVDHVSVCGGGAHNTLLLDQLALHVPCTVTTTSEHGVDPDWVEAMAFAWLAKQTIEGKTGNIPSVTGATRAAVLGAIYSA